MRTSRWWAAQSDQRLHYATDDCKRLAIYRPIDTQLISVLFTSLRVDLSLRSLIDSLNDCFHWFSLLCCCCEPNVKSTEKYSQSTGRSHQRHCRLSNTSDHWMLALDRCHRSLTRALLPNTRRHHNTQPCCFTTLQLGQSISSNIAWSEMVIFQVHWWFMTGLSPIWSLIWSPIEQTLKGCRATHNRVERC